MRSHGYVLKKRIGSGSWSQIVVADCTDTDYIDSSIDLSTIQYKVYYRIYGKIYGELSNSAPQVVYNPPPVSVDIGGPSVLESAEIGEFTANTTGGEYPLSYEWYKFQECSELDGFSCGSWKKLSGNTSSIMVSGFQPGFRVKIVVTAQNSSDTDIHYVDVY